jgi:hypothetical protein
MMPIRMPRGSAHKGVCIAEGVVTMGGACKQRKENRVCGGQSVSSARMWSEWGDVWRYNGKPQSCGG